VDSEKIRKYKDKIIEVNKKQGGLIRGRGNTTWKFVCDTYNSKDSNDIPTSNSDDNSDYTDDNHDYNRKQYYSRGIKSHYMPLENKETQIPLLNIPTYP